MSQSDDSRILHTGDFLQLRRSAHWEYIRRTRSSGGAAFLIATTPAGELVLVEQYRIPVSRPVIELPAGIVGDHDPDESPETAARRELEEETGYRAGQVELLFEGPTAAGIMSEWAWFLRMRDLERVGAGGGVGEEDITTHCVALDEVPAWLAAQQAHGALVDAKIYSALFWLAHESPAPLANPDPL